MKANCVIKAMIYKDLMLNRDFQASIKQLAATVSVLEKEDADEQQSEWRLISIGTQLIPVTNLIKNNGSRLAKILCDYTLEEVCVIIQEMVNTYTQLTKALLPPPIPIKQVIASIVSIRKIARKGFLVEQVKEMDALIKSTEGALTWMGSFAPEGNTIVAMMGYGEKTYIGIDQGKLEPMPGSVYREDKRIIKFRVDSSNIKKIKIHPSIS